MTALIRSPHFKTWCEDTYVKCCHINGMGLVEARDKWREEIHQDFTNLAWILDSIFPHTKWDTDTYAFISDPVSHSSIKDPSKASIDVGRITLKVINGRENILFENPLFLHGQIDKNGWVRCYGGFGGNFNQKVMSIGFSGALMEFYNFARVSDHATYYDGKPWN